MASDTLEPVYVASTAGDILSLFLKYMTNKAMSQFLTSTQFILPASLIAV